MDIFVNNLWNNFFTQIVFMYLTPSTYSKYAAEDFETRIGEKYINEIIIKEYIKSLKHCEKRRKCS